MNLIGVENASKIKSLARFHFICGMPRSGMSVLAALLNQNPRIVAKIDGPAEAALSNAWERAGVGGIEENLMDPTQQKALWRGVLDAVYHDRPFDSVVLDVNPNWLKHMDELVAIYPLARFIICVRNPAAIVNSLALSSGHSQDNDEALAQFGASLLEDEGVVGQQIANLRAALSGRHAERILVLDYDRLTDDPEDAICVVYDFLRELEYPHNYSEIECDEIKGVSGPVQRSNPPALLPTRTVLQLSGKAFWRNLKRTSATMMLGRAR